MILEGIVKNGVIVPDGPPPPEGTRVRMEVVEDDFDDIGPPPTTETHEEYLASLRASIAATDAGEKGKSVADVFGEIDRELKRPANGEG